VAGLFADFCEAALVFGVAGWTDTVAGFAATFTVVGDGFASFAAVAGTTFTVGLGVFASDFLTTVGVCANAAAVIAKKKASFRFIASCLWSQLLWGPAQYRG
jgi:hypothetical protein